MVRRVTTSGAEPLERMTRDKALAVMREIGAAGDPNDPRYAQVRERVIEAFMTDHYPRVDREHAGRIFDTFRRRPDLLPDAPPAGLPSDTRLILPPSIDPSA